MRAKVADEIEEKVIEMLQAGFKRDEVAQVLGIATSTISRITLRRGYSHPRKLKQGSDVAEMIREYWPPKMPEPKVKPKVRKRTNFRTPYNYPRMWKER